MYSRPDIEDYLDKTPIGATGEMADIWDGTALRDVTGPHDGLPFMQKPESEGRLVFGLNMDGFHPHGSREAGKRTSICGIYLVCFNLPPALRFKMENVFILGIVPGPQEPSTHEVNHLLRPLVDDLLILWNPGIYLSRTARYPFGRLVRAALIPVICDLPATRRVAGLGGHASGHFCSECLLKLDDINNLEPHTWQRRDYQSHMEHAQRWKDAETESDRTEVFQEYGAKWSELLRLPYWDPTTFVVIDSMHGFYLRLYLRHVRDVWGMNIKFADGDGFPDLNLSEADLSKAHTVLQSGKREELQKLPRPHLQYLCCNLGLHYSGRKSTLINLLLTYQQSQDWIGSSSGSNPLWTVCEDGSSSVDPMTVPNPPTVNSEAVQSHSSGSKGLNLDEAAHNLYVGGRTAITTARKQKLVELYAYITGAEIEECKMLTRDQLLGLIFDLRSADKITGRTPVNIKAAHGPDGSGEVESIPKAVQPTFHSSEVDHLMQLYEKGSKTALRKIRKPLLAVLCVVKFGRNCDAMNKDELLDQIYEARLAEELVDEDGALLDHSTPKKTNVLGKDTLGEIRRDMEELKLPSWFRVAPKHPGEVRWGKFKTDEWKSFCTVNLPITLSRLWGKRPKVDRHYRMLDNFLQLVTAVNLANQRRITEEEIIRYHSHISAYLKGFVDLYPFANITPYQHLSLHFAIHLRWWGPTHSWRCFAFERYNGVLQGLPTNNKFGDLEKSKFLRFCRSQNLCHLFTEAQLPVEIFPMIATFETRYKVNIRGTLLDDVGSYGIEQRIKLGGKHPDFDENHIACIRDYLSNNLGIQEFIPSRAVVLRHVERSGRRYQSGGNPNSVIIFSSPDTTPKAGQIVLIFSYSSHTFAIIRRFRELKASNRPFDFTVGLAEAAGVSMSV